MTSTFLKGYYATDELKGKKCRAFAAEKMTSITAVSCTRTYIQFIRLCYRYHKWTHLIPKPFCKKYVNAEYGQEMFPQPPLPVHCSSALTFNLQVL